MGTDPRVGAAANWLARCGPLRQSLASGRGPVLAEVKIRPGTMRCYVLGRGQRWWLQACHVTLRGMAYGMGIPERRCDGSGKSRRRNNVVVALFTSWENFWSVAACI